MVATYKPMPETSHFAPALASVSGDGPGTSYVLAWTGTDGQAKLNTSYSDTSGTVWDKMIVRDPNGGSSESSIAAPALVQHNDILFLCWTDQQGRLQLMSSTDKGRTWSAKQPIAQESSIAGPALATYDGDLVVAWTGTDGAGTLCIATSGDDGQSWAKVVLPEWSIAGPALTSYIDGAGFTYLFVGFTGTDHQLRVRFCQSRNYQQFTVPASQGSVVTGQTSDDAPSLSVLGQGEGVDIDLAIAWTGSGNRQLNAAYSNQGFSPFGRPGTAPDDRSSGGPAMLTSRHFPEEPDSLILAWTDQSSRLNFCGADVIMSAPE
jgi:hypothetical protein